MNHDAIIISSTAPTSDRNYNLFRSEEQLKYNKYYFNAEIYNTRLEERRKEFYLEKLEQYIIEPKRTMYQIPMTTDSTSL